jgi:hypothetical protein
VSFADEMAWMRRERPALEASLAASGWAYVDYPHHGRGYGLAFATDEGMSAVATEAGMGASMLCRGGWLEQDVWMLKTTVRASGRSAASVPSWPGGRRPQH